MEKKELNSKLENAEERRHKPRKISSLSTGPTFKRVIKKDDDGPTYKYNPPKKDYSKYK